MPASVKLDLAPLGFDGQYVNLFDPKYLSQRRFEEVVNDMLTAQIAPPPLPEGATPEERAARAEAEAARSRLIERAGLRDRIESWYVLDADTGAPLGDPQTADLQGLPLGVTGAITEKISELFEATVPLRLRKG